MNIKKNFIIIILSLISLNAEEPSKIPSDIAQAAKDSLEKTTTPNESSHTTRMSIPSKEEVQTFLTWLASVSQWVKQPYEDSNFSSTSGIAAFGKNLLKTPFHLISNHPLETTLLTIAGIAYYRYYMKKYKKIAKGLVYDIDQGMHAAEESGARASGTKIATHLQNNTNLLEDLKALESDLYEKLALPERNMPLDY